MSDLNELIRRIAREEIKSSQPIRREPARVISVSEGYLRAAVRFSNGSEFTLLNKTGERLCEGDSVWVYYTSLVSDGHIAIRNGEPDPLGGTGGSSLYIENAAVLTQEQAASMLREQEIINVDVYQKTTAVYGHPEDRIIVSGMPAMVNYSYGSTTALTTRYIEENVTVEDLITNVTFTDISRQSLDEDHPMGCEWELYTLMQSVSFSTVSQSESYCKRKAYVVRTYRKKDSQVQSGVYTVQFNVTEDMDGTSGQYIHGMGFVPMVSSISADQSYTANGITVSTPYGYAVLAAYTVAIYGADGEALTAAVSSSGDSFVVPFASAAERDYALAVTTRSEVIPVGE